MWSLHDEIIKSTAENEDSFQATKETKLKKEIKEECSSSNDKQLIEGYESNAISPHNYQTVLNLPETIWVKKEVNEDDIMSNESLHFKKTPEIILLKQKIKQECESTDDEQFSENNQDQVGVHFKKTPEIILLKQAIKQECESTDDEQFTENNQGQVGVHDDIKTENDNPSPEPYHFDPNDANLCESDTLNIKPEDETIGHESIQESSTTRDKRPHKCTQCNYSARYLSNLTKHMKMIHNKQNVEKFFCEQCNFSTIYNNYLVTHRRTHNSVKPFQCEICQKYFHHKIGYKIHMNKHHPESCAEKIQMFQCDKCSYSTAHRRNFASHKRKHGDTENLTKYTCPTCEYSTYHKHHLKAHVLIHGGKKPFACEHCDYSCIHSSNLKRHVQRRHNKPS